MRSRFSIPFLILSSFTTRNHRRRFKSNRLKMLSLPSCSPASIFVYYINIISFICDNNFCHKPQKETKEIANASRAVFLMQRKHRHRSLIQKLKKLVVSSAGARFAQLLKCGRRPPPVSPLLKATFRRTVAGAPKGRIRDDCMREKGGDDHVPSFVSPSISKLSLYHQYKFPQWTLPRPQDQRPPRIPFPLQRFQQYRSSAHLPIKPCYTVSLSFFPLLS